MTLSLLFLLTTCCLTAVLVFVLLLWRRELRRLADAEARERDAATRLSPPKPGWPPPSRPPQPKKKPSGAARNRCGR